MRRDTNQRPSRHCRWVAGRGLRAGCVRPHRYRTGPREFRLNAGGPHVGRIGAVSRDRSRRRPPTGPRPPAVGRLPAGSVRRDRVSAAHPRAVACTGGRRRGGPGPLPEGELPEGELGAPAQPATPDGSGPRDCGSTTVRGTAPTTGPNRPRARMAGTDGAAPRAADATGRDRFTGQASVTPEMERYSSDEFGNRSGRIGIG